MANKQNAKAGFAEARCSVTVVRCSCGAAQAYEHNPTGDTRKAGRILIGLFRHFHEPHGTVTVESQNARSEPRRECDQANRKKARLHVERAKTKLANLEAELAASKP